MTLSPPSPSAPVAVQTVAAPAPPSAVPSPFSRLEFADLYSLMQLSADATTDALRARINTLYIEAQRNLDHHNFRKRFYYQQMFEVHLPQAHAWLLERSRRAYYDACLQAWRQEREFPPVPIFDPLPSGASAINGASNTNGASSLADLPSSSPSGTATVRVPKGATNVWNPPMPSAEQFSAMAELANEALHSLPPRTVVAPAPRNVPEQVLTPQVKDQRRDHKRRALIERELRAASRIWSSVGATLGAGPIVLGASLWGRANPQNDWMAWVAGTFVAGAAAWFGSREASRRVRRAIVGKLSKMPYEQLLQRCGQ